MGLEFSDNSKFLFWRGTGEDDLVVVAKLVPLSGVQGNELGTTND